jgi:hypothetical protein
MNYYPYNPNIGQTIQTNCKGINVDQSFLAHFQVSAATAVAGSNTAVLAATALTAATQAVTANITNPAVPRNIKIIGNAAGIAGNVVIKGTNYNGDVITETIVLNGITAVEGSKAFKTVTEIDLPIETHAGTDTVSVGFGEKLGLPYKLSHNTVLLAYLDNAKEATAPTVAVDSAILENNTIKLNSTLAGKVVDAYLIV